MDIADVIKAKHETENKIHAALNDIIADFVAHTGVSVHGVDVSMVMYHSIGECGNGMIVDGIHIDARL